MHRGRAPGRGVGLQPQPPLASGERGLGGGLSRIAQQIKSKMLPRELVGVSENFCRKRNLSRF